MPLATKSRNSYDRWAPKRHFVQLPEAFTRDPWITHDANGALITADVRWLDGGTGTFEALTLSSAFPGAVDSYSVTHTLGGVTKTYTQPLITRNSSGDETAVPAIVVT